ncbi:MULTISPECIES: hypothetical protein [Lonsdalea]|nr:MULTISPECIES: hypothetical protein [Lonsdalea]
MTRYEIFGFIFSKLRLDINQLKSHSQMKKLVVITLSAAILLSGCATIVGERSQVVNVDSHPTGVKFSIQDETGQVVVTGNTPQNVVLDKSNGHYFGGKNT